MIKSVLWLALVLLMSPNVNAMSRSLYKQYEASMIEVKLPNGWGSGFITRAPSGHSVVVTNNHVCFDNFAQQPFKDMEAVDHTGKVISKLSFITTNAGADVCILKMDRDMPDKELPIKIKPLERSQPVHVLGYPYVGDRIPMLTPSDGYTIEATQVPFVFLTISPICLPHTTKLGEVAGMLSICRQDFVEIAITNTIRPGNSGSAVFDNDGDVIGVVNLGNQETHQGLFVPAIYIVDLLKGL